jgi:5'-nucleotidase
MRPYILISNDDGVSARGINFLVDTLRPYADILVVAPDGPRSGGSCAITTTVPLRYTLLRKEDGLTVYSCTGTPVDCVKVAINELIERTPTVVIGGINHGDNSAVNAHYSGTMGVVLEGCMKGIPSVAFSLCSHDADADFTPTYDVIRKIVAKVLEKGLPKGSCLNVNFPDSPSYAGVKVCRQAMGRWVNEWEVKDDPRGSNGKWLFLTGEFVVDDTDPEADRVALDNNYVTITPISIDMTDYKLLDEMKQWNL